MTATARLPHLPALDGLRGIAVSLVVLHHLLPTLLPGGYVGVDVFFVLSGFLITRRIAADHATGSFRLGRFYAARLRRLFPALLLLLPAVLALGWCSQLAHEFRSTGQHAASAALFIANIRFWREGSYFAEDSWHDPLRHLWSLAVEEQFYLLWPLLLPLLLRLRGKAWLATLVLLLLGIAAALHPLDGSARSSFYLLPYRAWELLLGAVLAMWTLPVLSPASRSGVQLIGLLAIAVNAFLPGSEHALVLSQVALATAGAAMLIATATTSGTGRGLDGAVLGYLGRISYPLYLWHWPLIALARLLWWDEVPVVALVLIALLSLLLAAASERWVEAPVRAALRLQRLPAALIFLALPMGGVYLMARWVGEGRVTERLHAVSAVRSTAVLDKAVVPQAVIAGTLPGTVLLLGDSYVGQLYPRLDSLHRSGVPMRTVRFHGRVGCPPMGLHSTLDTGCAAASAEAFRLALDTAVHAVVIGSSWLGAAQRMDLHWPGLPAGDASWQAGLAYLEQQLAALRSAGKEVYLLLNPPGGAWAHPANAPYERLAARTGLDRNTCPEEDHNARVGAVNDALRAIAQRQAVHLIDLAELLCAEGLCNASDPDGRPRYSDATHLRAAYVRCCVPVLDGVVGE
ncbi:MAG: acyltransferase family protein [Flavobacteriales bacterium]